MSGKLRAYGSALYLKNTFGSGYHVTCLCSEDRAPAVLALVRKTLPVRRGDTVPHARQYTRQISTRLTALKAPPKTREDTLSTSQNAPQNGSATPERTLATRRRT